MLYRNSRNTYFATPKDNLKDKIEVEIGDSKQDDFFPQVKICRWDNEVNFSARLKHNEKNPIFYTSNHKVYWKGEKIEAEFYEIQDGDENASEFNIILKEKPETNKIEFTIKTKGLDFFYRGELNDEEKANGAVLSDGALGSYAVYSSEYKKNIFGGKEYKSGKVGQILRPKIVDSSGLEVLGDLYIDKQNEILTVIIPQNFLDNAVYPVQHCAGLTFGYTTKGSAMSTWSGSRASLRASTIYTAVDNDTITSYSAYLQSTSAELGAYSFSGGLPVNKLGSAITGTAGGAPGSWQSTETVKHVMSDGVSYCVALRSGGNVYYDNLSGTNQSKDNATSLPATWTNVGTFSYVFSMYATYSNIPSPSTSISASPSSSASSSISPSSSISESPSSSVSPSSSISSSISESPSSSVSSSLSPSSSISASVSSSISASPSPLPEPPELRDFTNRPGVVYDETKTTVVFAEDMALIKDWLAYLKSKIEFI